MTDWLPWGFALMAGTFTTMALTLRALARPAPHDLRPARVALVATAVASGGLYALYLMFGECWLPYVRCR